MEENKKKNSRKSAGRKPKSDPAVHRYVVRLNSEENGRFDIQFQKSGLKERSKFIKTMIFGKEIKRAQIEVDESNGRFSGSWEATDALTVYAKGSQTGEETQKFTYDASSKVFKGQLTNATQDWTYQAVYPAVDATPLNIPFGAERTQKGSNFNGAYDPLVSALVTHAGAEPGKTPQGEAVTFGLNRLTAILALTFETDDATVKAEKVKSVGWSS